MFFCVHLTHKQTVVEWSGHRLLRSLPHLLVGSSGAKWPTLVEIFAPPGEVANACWDLCPTCWWVSVRQSGQRLLRSLQHPLNVLTLNECPLDAGSLLLSDVSSKFQIMLFNINIILSLFQEGTLLWMELRKWY